MVSFRKMGKASFTHIQDESGKIQIYLKNDLLQDNIYDKIVLNLDLVDTNDDSLSLQVTEISSSLAPFLEKAGYEVSIIE